jgi:membrane-associated phospholipid phosphatase
VALRSVWASNRVRTRCSARSNGGNDTANALRRLLSDAIIASLLMVRRTRRVACSFGAVLVASWLLTTALKYVVGRRRPPYVLPDVRSLWGAATTPSFPSGHATAAFALAAFLVSFWNKRASSPWGLVGSVLLSVWAAGVAISRVFLGCPFSVRRNRRGSPWHSHRLARCSNVFS